MSAGVEQVAASDPEYRAAVKYARAYAVTDERVPEAIRTAFHDALLVAFVHGARWQQRQAPTLYAPVRGPNRAQRRGRRR